MEQSVWEKCEAQTRVHPEPLGAGEGPTAGSRLQPPPSGLRPGLPDHDS